MAVGGEEVGMQRDEMAIMYTCPKAGDRANNEANEGKLLVASKPGISVAINVLESRWSSGGECEYGGLKREAAFPKKGSHQWPVIAISQIK